ncbi:MFS transporter [Beijerinckiaceae bacterium RH AL1]|nr:MFS transporter [Beijerinckiaceae bacterium]VVB44541.1 MFS transporter [Beijerinckiaceae bacterium RH CH11]VVB44620.1 MFS transporter [Beijerinckiaceae bacterium RH AL8]VVC54410.1 MFS transporter [Beijerinckiaceae bacterium RH AL1]
MARSRAAASPLVLWVAFASLYAPLFGAFGAEVPYLPAYLLGIGLSTQQIGFVLAAATLAQSVFAPLTGMVADRVGKRLVLACAAAASGAGMALYGVTSGFAAALVVAVTVAIATAALSPLADALAVPTLGKSGAYGRVRAFGSAGFIAGSFASGALIEHGGLASIIPLAAVLFVVAAAPLPFLPAIPRADREAARGGLFMLLRSRPYLYVLCVSALAIGSHAMVDNFAVISWRAGAVSGTTVAILLALAVGSELVVFTLLGPPLVRRYGASACICIGAMAGCGRWIMFAESRALWVIGASQALHGLTFALTHLACMRVIAEVVPRKVAGTALALYGTISSGLASAAISLVAGSLYATFGERAFWLAAALSAAAIPFALRLDRYAVPSETVT